MFSASKKMKKNKFVTSKQMFKRPEDTFDMLINESKQNAEKDKKVKEDEKVCKDVCEEEVCDVCEEEECEEEVFEEECEDEECEDEECEEKEYEELHPFDRKMSTFEKITYTSVNAIGAASLINFVQKSFPNNCVFMGYILPGVVGWKFGKYVTPVMMAMGLSVSQ